MIWSLLEEVIHDLVAQGQTFGPQSSFRRSLCRPPFSYLHRSNGVTPLIEVVPMGVYYNISKLQPHWISLEPSACQIPNLVHRQSRPQSSFHGSVCRPQFSYLHKSDGATPLIEVVPMGVYYNISKFQPNWISLEPSACQKPNLVHRQTFAVTCA